MRILVTTVLLVSSIAIAGDLEDKKRWAGIAETMNYLEKDRIVPKCGKEIPWDIDRASWKGINLDPPSGVSPGQCTQIIAAVASVCSDDADSKAAVVAKIKKVSCKYGGPIKDVAKEENMRPEQSVKAQEFKLGKDGTLVWILHYGPTTTGFEFGFDSGHPAQDTIYRFLKKQL